MAHLVGTFRLGRDAERHDGANGGFLALSLAYDVYENGDTRPQWIRATLGGDRANRLADSLKKGSTVYAVIKDARLAKFNGADGKEQHALEGRVVDIEFVGSAPGRRQEGQSPEG